MLEEILKIVRFTNDFNVNPSTFIYNEEANRGNKTLLFLAGMRGSGKTSELAKIANKLNHPQGFFCVICNLDEGLDLKDMEYMDIVIFQLVMPFDDDLQDLLEKLIILEYNDGTFKRVNPIVEESQLYKQYVR